MFRTPTLLNVAETAPYFHSGLAKTLEEVIWFYNVGGGQSGTFAGKKSPEIRPLGLTEAEVSDLVEFLKSLTGKTPAQVAAEGSRRRSTGARIPPRCGTGRRTPPSRRCLPARVARRARAAAWARAARRAGAAGAARRARRRAGRCDGRGRLGGRRDGRGRRGYGGAGGATGTGGSA